METLLHAGSPFFCRCHSVFLQFLPARLEEEGRGQPKEQRSQEVREDFGGTGRQVTAQKQVWHGTDLPHLRLGFLRVHGGEGGETIHTEASWSCSPFFPLIPVFSRRGAAGGGARGGRWGAARPPLRARVVAPGARGGTVHFLFPCRRRGGPGREGGGGGAWRRRAEAGRGRPRWRRTCWRTSWRYGRGTNKGGPRIAGGLGAGPPAPAVEAAALGGARASGAGHRRCPPAGRGAGHAPLG